MAIATDLGYMPPNVRSALQRIDVLLTDAELGTHHRALEAARPRLRLFRIEQLDEEPETGTFRGRACRESVVTPREIA